MGLWRSSKYESDGGPGLREVAGLLSAAVDRRHLATARADLARAAIFNWVAAGTDAHAKNFALLHVGSRTALAPLYDLLSATLLWEPDEIRYRARLAMKLGGEYRLRRIGARHIVSAAADLGVDADWLLQVASDYAAALPDAVRDATARERDLIDAAVAARFIDRTARRADDVAHALRAADRTTASAQHGENLHEEGPTGGAIWVPGHTRAGRAVAGHWRGRPGR
jgi:serine/threonine-protein kinase HipA